MKNYYEFALVRNNDSKVVGGLYYNMNGVSALEDTSVKDCDYYTLDQIQAFIKTDSVMYMCVDKDTGLIKNKFSLSERADYISHGYSEYMVDYLERRLKYSKPVFSEVGVLGVAEKDNFVACSCFNTISYNNENFIILYFYANKITLLKFRQQFEYLFPMMTNTIEQSNNLMKAFVPFSYIDNLRNFNGFTIKFCMDYLVYKNAMEGNSTGMMSFINYMYDIAGSYTRNKKRVIHSNTKFIKSYQCRRVDD